MDSVDTIEQILSEFAVVNHLLQIAVGGADQSDIHGYLSGATHSHDASALQGGEELCLKAIREVSDFVQKDGAAICQLKLAWLVHLGIRKCALHMTEQFALEKGFRNGSHVHRQHLLTAASRQPMNLVSQYLLARTVLARDKDVGIGGCHLLHHVSQIGHHLAVSPVHHALRILSSKLARGFVRSLVLVPCLRQRADHLPVVERLDDEVGCTFLDARYGKLYVGISGEEHHLGLRTKALDFSKPEESLVPRIDATRKVHVEQNHVRMFLSEFGRN